MQAKQQLLLHKSCKYARNENERLTNGRRINRARKKEGVCTVRVCLSGKEKEIEGKRMGPVGGVGDK